MFLGENDNGVTNSEVKDESVITEFRVMRHRLIVCLKLTLISLNLQYLVLSQKIYTLINLGIVLSL